MTDYTFRRLFVFGRLIFSCFLMIFLLTSCNRKGQTIVFNESDAINLNPEYQWALVVSPYTACYQDCDYASVVATHFRKGEILQVIGQETVMVDERRELWYAFDAGWIPALSLQIYSNRLKAENAAGKL